MFEASSKIAVRLSAVAACIAVLAACSGGPTSMTSLPGTLERSESAAAVPVAPADADLFVDASSNVIEDGGFETPAAPTGGLSRYDTGSKLGPWSVVGAGTVDVLNAQFSFGGYTFAPKTGKQQVDLTGNTQNVTGVEQTVATTVGHTYTLSFYVGNVIDESAGLGVSSTVNVQVDGVQTFTATNSKSIKAAKPYWELFTFTFKATSTKTTLAFFNGDPSNDTYDGLDGVSLTP
jgi:hypothetical protein